MYTQNIINKIVNETLIRLKLINENLSRAEKAKLENYDEVTYELSKKVFDIAKKCYNNGIFKKGIDISKFKKANLPDKITIIINNHGVTPLYIGNNTISIPIKSLRVDDMYAISSITHELTHCLQDCAGENMDYGYHFFNNEHEFSLRNSDWGYLVYTLSPREMEARLHALKINLPKIITKYIGDKIIKTNEEYYHICADIFERTQVIHFCIGIENKFKLLNNEYINSLDKATIQRMLFDIYTANNTKIPNENPYKLVSQAINFYMECYNDFKKKVGKLIGNEIVNYIKMSK